MARTIRLLAACAASALVWSAVSMHLETEAAASPRSVLQRGLTLEPAQLGLGAAPRLPRINARNQLVVGSKATPLPGKVSIYAGKIDAGWLVVSTRQRGSVAYAVTPDGSTITLATNVEPSSVQVSQDGGWFSASTPFSEQGSTLSIRNTTDGAVAAAGRFDLPPTVLAVRQRRLLLSDDKTGTFWWRPATRRTTEITRRRGYLADPRLDLLASYTKDPYQGGCMVLSRLRNPSTKLWTSCNYRIAAFSPDGRRIATVDLLSDGLGPTQVRTRSSSGAVLTEYAARWFGGVAWESNDTLLLDTHGRRESALVRCRADACENTEIPVPTQLP